MDEKSCDKCIYKDEEDGLCYHADDTGEFCQDKSGFINRERRN